MKTGASRRYGVQKRNPALPDTIVSELEWDYGGAPKTARFHRDVLLYLHKNQTKIVQNHLADA